LNHERSKTASFVSCLDACLDAVGVRPPLVLLVDNTMPTLDGRLFPFIPSNFSDFVGVLVSLPLYL
jgi:hypothetical protein